MVSTTALRPGGGGVSPRVEVDMLEDVRQRLGIEPADMTSWIMANHVAQIFYVKGWIWQEPAFEMGAASCCCASCIC